MPSFIRAAAVAAFAAVASAQFSNSTLPAAAAVAGWTYVGCELSTAAQGALVETSSFMTPQRCTLDCSAYEYALVNGQNCYCASTLNGTTPVAESACSTRCPGNSGSACGGAAPGAKRQAAGTVVSVYEKQAIVPAGEIYLTVINNIYVDYCPEAQALTTLTYCSTATLTGCGCKNATVATVPVTTTVYTCPLAGTTSVVTLTVPAGVTAGTVSAGVATVTASTTTVVAGVTSTVSACPGCATTAAATTVAVATATKAAYTGAANSMKVGSGLLAGAAVAAALL